MAKIKTSIFSKLSEKQRQEALSLVIETIKPAYLYWDKVKYKKLPNYLTPEEFWQIIKFVRDINKEETVIKDEKGNFFSWQRLPGLEEFLHEVDLNTGGSLFISNIDDNQKLKYKFISRGIMEEAIASSQLEGANTSRKAARQMLWQGRKPKNRSEYMILNNYETMKAIEEDYKDRSLSLEILLGLHQMITKDILDKKDQGRLRKDEDSIQVWNENENLIYHFPPKMKFVTYEIERLIKFANDELPGPFLHPVIKAIMLHFWMGYLHPFIDGNGRMARLLFYWYLLKHKYWAFAYLPISKTIKSAPKQYAMSYVYSEQDDNDLTYFIDFNIKKLQLAIKDFENYVKEKAKENSLMNKLAKTRYNLNDRQVQLLQYYQDNNNEYTTPKMHMNIYQISKLTAIHDLKKLEKLGFVKSIKKGRNLLYFATESIKELYT